MIEPLFLWSIALSVTSLEAGLATAINWDSNSLGGRRKRVRLPDDKTEIVLHTEPRRRSIWWRAPTMPLCRS